MMNYIDIDKVCKNILNAIDTVFSSTLIFNEKTRKYEISEKDFEVLNSFLELWEKIK